MKKKDRSKKVRKGKGRSRKGRTGKGRSSVTGQGDPHSDEFKDMFPKIDVKDFNRFREEYVSTMAPLVILYCDSKNKMIDDKKEFSERFRICYPNVDALENIYHLNEGDTRKAIAALIAKIVPSNILRRGKEEHKRHTRDATVKKSIRKGKSRGRK
jgi:hypothetical protein|tara:strand:- start:148 stop:615 length:468 start_codon:yes stop_codon:yes gene_type:complete